MTAFLKIVNYDKIKFTFLFLDIVKNQLLISCRFYANFYATKHTRPWPASFLFPALLAEETSASREDFNFVKAEA